MALTLCKPLLSKNPAKLGDPDFVQKNITCLNYKVPAATLDGKRGLLLFESRRSVVTAVLRQTTLAE